jgi:signal transduction histidine kinase
VKLEASVQRPPGPVLGDAARIQQIALNLIANAIKFTPAGGRVDVIVSCRGPSAVLTVRDTGHGVEPALLPHVFEPFTQGMTERRHEGLGLGLAIVRHLVELHHGTVLVESAGLGAGTTVTVELPLAVSVPVREGAAEPRA